MRQLSDLLQRNGTDDPTPRFPGVEPLAPLAVGKRTVTWDAFDTDRRTRCILKVIRRHRRHDEEVAESVRREGRALAELAHPHLVRGYGMLPRDESGLIGFTMQTIPGATLDGVIEDGPLSVDDVVQLSVQMASALRYLHCHSWIHLDVKPSNIIVHGGQAILIDLGLLGRPGERRDGSGTRGYLPPEQAVDVALTPAADVFALGVTLFEALTGRRPYGAVPPWSERGIRRLRTLRRATSATTRDSGFSTNRALPDVLAELLDRMLDLEPEQRPGMDSVWHRLDSIARDAEKRRLSR
ncbi:serine/threonine-protein kinase [Gordonia hongkongensis]|uniref:non-specific serine/threonine protein kinase n=1 Tax=Gordonia hongkongensis TaxID=1701090 RepID=A0ABT6BVM1_9ACTN|nr:serine/threonine-protein kinase [Gordonia hongkongensis]MDF6101770.1 serine/threonine protein kinase [Gordonia hongkongensis]